MNSLLAGTSTAIVGASGFGKSTLSKLIFRNLVLILIVLFLILAALGAGLELTGSFMLYRSAVKMFLEVVKILFRANLNFLLKN